MLVRASRSDPKRLSTLDKSLPLFVIFSAMGTSETLAPAKRKIKLSTAHCLLHTDPAKLVLFSGI